MGRSISIELEPIEFKGIGYHRVKKATARRNKGEVKDAIITLPARFAGHKFDMILVPREVIKGIKDIHKQLKEDEINETEEPESGEEVLPQEIEEELPIRKEVSILD
jgi:hypothetical protein